MSSRFTEFQAILATRDAGLLQLALLAVAVLACWLAVRIVFSPKAQDRLIALGAIVFHLSLLSIILGGSS